MDFGIRETGGYSMVKYPVRLLQKCQKSFCYVDERKYSLASRNHPPLISQEKFGP